MNIATAKVEHIIPVGQEPEGVSTAPDGKSFYVTCEAGGDIFRIDTTKYSVVAHFKVEGRPRSMDFLPGAAIGFIPSESAGQLNVIDTANDTVRKTITLLPGSRPMKVRVGAGRLQTICQSATGAPARFQYSMPIATSCATRSRWELARGASDSHRTARYCLPPTVPPTMYPWSISPPTRRTARIKVGERPWGIAVVSAAREPNLMRVVAGCGARAKGAALKKSPPTGRTSTSSDHASRGCLRTFT